MIDEGKSDPSLAVRPSAGRRIDLIDALRGVLLLAMASYHFTWDLENFGYVDRGLTGHGAWKLYARCIATSFLFLVGVGLVLGHGRGIRWRAFLRRWTAIAAGSAAITAATYFATPDGYVFFGILHQIALASVVGLLFVGRPPLLAALTGLLVIGLPQVVTFEALDGTVLSITGLAARPPVSNDFVPVFPWTGVVLLGIAAAGFAERAGLVARLASANSRMARARSLAFLGRYSLIFYLVHQPVLFGLVALAAQIAPPDPARILAGECRRGCIALRDEASCAAYCRCIGEKVGGGELLSAIIANRTTADEDERLQGMVRQCAMAIDQTPMTPRN